MTLSNTLVDKSGSHNDYWLAFDEGEQSYERSVTQDDNPYRVGLIEISKADAWDDGWEYGQREERFAA